LRLLPTAVAGAWICEPEPVADERGMFARLVDLAVLERHGVRLGPTEASVALNHRAGTVRGMHWQAEPAPETKLVRCTRGAVWDVVVDRRPGSPTEGAHAAVELTAEGRRTLLVPPLCAHGYQSLVDDAEVSYAIEGAYAPEAARGLRFDDPALGIDWPLPVTVVSGRDRSWPLVGGAG
jgi:dTDP-4-dehydrorhamnose 3,5-epimerase